MIGSFLTRALVMVFGYAYPAYECYKTVEQNKPDIEQLIFWCQYWILVAFLTVCERIGDAFISWLPMYSEGKLAFFIYLWYSKTRGTAFIYDSFFKPYVAKHETEIDRNLLELRTRAGDIAVVYWQKAASYGQTRIFDILQYIAAQSTPRPRPTQPQRPGSGVRQTSSAANRQPAATTQPQGQEPSSPTSSSSSSQNQEEVAEEEGHSEVPEPPLPEAVLSTPKLIANPPAAETSTITASSEAEAMQIESVSSLENQNANPPLKETKETIIEETIRITRARLRKNRTR